MAMFNTLVNAMAPGPVIILEGMCLEDSNLIAEASRQFNFILVRIFNCIKQYKNLEGKQ